MFCPKLVVAHLMKSFGSCDIGRAPTRKEQKLINSFSSILRDVVHDNLVIGSKEDSTVEEEEADPEWVLNDEEQTPRRETGSFLFGDVEVPKEQVWKAITHYRPSAKGFRTLSSMNAKFRFIRSEYHLLKLRQIEREGEIHADRLIALRTLTDKLKEEVLSKFEVGVTLHDSDIRQMAIRINQEISLVKDSQAGHHWIQGFKRKREIVSQRVTTFRSRGVFWTKIESPQKLRVSFS